MFGFFCVFLCVFCFVLNKVKKEKNRKIEVANIAPLIWQWEYLNNGQGDLSGFTSF